MAAEARRARAVAQLVGGRPTSTPTLCGATAAPRGPSGDMTSRDSPSFDHLDRLSDHRGIFEHAEGTVRREEHGYCVDDNARLLVVASRQGDIGAAHRLVAPGAALRARRPIHRWSMPQPHGSCGRVDRRVQHVEDCWGRSVWGLGVAATAPHRTRRCADRRSRGFDAAVRQRSRWPRAMAFAALGAADVLSADPGHRAARALLVDSLAAIGTGNHRGDWVWPEPRLAYANAALAEAMIAAGAALGRADDLAEGLTMLAWLLERETVAGHLSVTPVGGSGPGDRGPSSTSNRSRWRRWPTPAGGRTTSPANPSG